MKRQLLLVILLLLISCAKPDIPDIPDFPEINDITDIECSDGSNNCDIMIDFNEHFREIILHYGANEKDHWSGFVEIEQTHEYHKQAGSEYIRVWINDEDYTKNSIPLIDYEYDFSELDMFINAVLDSGALPFIVFANAPDSMRDSTYSPPWDINEFADYTEVIVNHYKDACENDWLEHSCDIRDWYFEVWNEPWRDEWWWDSLYIELYNTVYQSIKSIEPETKVGGYSLSYHEGKTDRLEEFLSGADMDFISLHIYGNSMDEYNSDEEKLSQLKHLLYDSIIVLREEISKTKKNDIEIINSEYSSDFTTEYMSRLDEDFTKMWYASALIWQIKSGVDIEMFYSGTTKHQDRGFGMWSVEGGLKTWPIYDMKSTFVSVNKRDSKIFKNTLTSNLDVLAIENDQGTYMTIVNNINQKNEAKICMNKDFDSMIDLNSWERYSISNCFRVPLEGYEVRFFELS